MYCFFCSSGPAGAFRGVLPGCRWSFYVGRVARVQELGCRPGFISGFISSFIPGFVSEASLCRGHRRTGELLRWFRVPRRLSPRTHPVFCTSGPAGVSRGVLGRPGVSLELLCGACCSRAGARLRPGFISGFISSFVSEASLRRGHRRTGELLRWFRVPRRLSPGRTQFSALVSALAYSSMFFV